MTLVERREESFVYAGAAVVYFVGRWVGSKQASFRRAERGSKKGRESEEGIVEIVDAILFRISTRRAKKDIVPKGGIEPPFSRPQRDVLTTIRLELIGPLNT